MSNAKRLVRKTDGRMIAGVASGMSDYFGIDVTLIRVLLVVTAIFGGFGLVVYIVMWILVPEEGSGKALFSESPAPDEATTPSDTDEEE
jgi:phage shock protein C